MKRHPRGIFEAFWNGQPNHLPLLSLIDLSFENKAFNLPKSLELLNQICSTHTPETISESIILLLRNPNWRPHLVAAFALLKLSPDEQKALYPKFWERLKFGSWASPQICVILSIIDPDFEDKAKSILKFDFSYFDEMLSDFEPLYKSEGPGKKIGSQKILAALDYLINANENPKFEDDGGASVAKGWRERFLELRDQGMVKIQSS